MPGIVYIGSLAIAGSLALEVWRATKQREHLWELYALRDELRRLAIDDDSVANGSAFRFLDSRLTEFCSCYRFHVLSLWHALVGFLLTRGNERAKSELSGFERCDGDARIEDTYRKAIASVGGLLFWRHIALFTLVLPTIVLPIFFWSSRKRIARYVFAHSARPGTRPPGTFVAT